MGRRYARVPTQRLPGAPVEYQCARVEDVWHAMQEQAAPPSISQGGAWTICAVWAPFTRGYERRRPTCPVCLRACEKDEGIASPTSPAALAQKLGADSVTPLKTKVVAGPLGAAAVAREVAATRSTATTEAIAHVSRALEEPHRTRAHKLLMLLVSYGENLPATERKMFDPIEAAAVSIQVGSAVADGFEAATTKANELAKALATARVCKPAIVNFINDSADKTSEKKVAAARAKHAAEAADFDAKLNALVDATRKNRR